jgi:hypothetical protein
MKVGTAGGFFQVTCGGRPMNSNDALIAWARKSILKKAVAMKKLKDQALNFESNDNKVNAIFARKPQDQWERWTVTELKAVIQWKQGPNPMAPLNHPLSGLRKQAFLHAEYVCQTLFGG